MKFFTIAVEGDWLQARYAAALCGFTYLQKAVGVSAAQEGLDTLAGVFLDAQLRGASDDAVRDLFKEEGLDCNKAPSGGWYFPDYTGQDARRHAMRVRDACAEMNIPMANVQLVTGRAQMLLDTQFGNIFEEVNGRAEAPLRAQEQRNEFLRSLGSGHAP